VVYHTERVLFRTAPLPLYLLSRHVQAAGVKVVLTGEGADEIFWGYPVFKEAKLRQFWRRNPQSTWRPLLLERIFPFMPQYSHRYIHLLIDSYRRSLPDSGMLDTHWSRIASCRHQKKFYSREFKDRLDGYDALGEFESSLREDLEQVEYLRRAQLVEQATLLAGYLLCSQGDRMTMAHSVEARFPYLDHEFAGFAFSLPDQVKLFGLKDKWILRKSFADKLPPAIVQRPKHPYQAPDVKGFFYADGTEADCVGQALSRSAVEQSGIFEWKVVDQFLHKVRTVSADRFSTQDNMALVQLLSTQLLSAQFERGFQRMREPAMTSFPITIPTR
jgi:asparagine synthase (glutamine-hydrolysing)